RRLVERERVEVQLATLAGRRAAGAEHVALALGGERAQRQLLEGSRRHARDLAPARCAPRRDPAPGAEARVGAAVGELDPEERKREPLEAARVEAPGLLAHPGEQLGVEGGAGGIGAHGTPCASRSSAPARTSRSMPSGGVIEITLPSSPDASAI